MTNSFVTNLHRKSCELLTSASADLADYTIGDSQIYSKVN